MKNNIKIPTYMLNHLLAYEYNFCITLSFGGNYIGSYILLETNVRTTKIHFNAKNVECLNSTLSRKILNLILKRDFPFMKKVKGQNHDSRITFII